MSEEHERFEHKKSQPEKQYYRVVLIDGSSMGFTSTKPELLEALESMVGRFGGDSRHILDTVAIKEARAAIAKAKGGVA